MAVNVNTVYQRVLAIANKEQRGYITPEEFNLFANQAQLDIFEQYFYDLNQFSRLPSNNTEYSNMIDILQEKISFHEGSTSGLTTSGPGASSNDTFSTLTLPALYRLGSVTYDDKTYPIEIVEVTKVEAIDLQKSALTRATINRPFFVRKSSTQLNIYPKSLSSTSALVNGSVSSQINIAIDNISGTEINVGDVVTGSGISGSSKCTVTSVINENNISISPAQSLSDNVTLTFTPTITVNSITAPADVKFEYIIVNGEALYDNVNSVNFGLHPSEETELVLKILELAGISIEDSQLYQAANQQEIKKLQQEKA